MGAHHPPEKHGIGFANLVRLVAMGLTAAAVVKELRTPAEERTWHGEVAGFVPYDFRVPTVARFKERIWDPKGEHLLSPQVFGGGWTVNLGRVVELGRRKSDD